jgi:membrane carboxypeptidase/penicillin-binding protein
MPVAGKTGTSQDDMNQWFVGMTPYYVAPAWLGYDLKNLRGEVLSVPTREQIAPIVNEQAIVELYSR